jgi:hypothetical protein
MENIFILSVSDWMNDEPVACLTNYDCCLDRTGKYLTPRTGLLLSQSPENNTKLRDTRGSALGEVTSYWPHTLEARVLSQGNACEICSEQSDTGTGFPVSA